jgi:hypothetical protein
MISIEFPNERKEAVKQRAQATKGKIFAMAADLESVRVSIIIRAILGVLDFRNIQKAIVGCPTTNQRDSSTGEVELEETYCLGS